jgi:hypothetical protein
MSEYTSRLQKGGALLEDFRALVRIWRDAPPERLTEEVICGNLLGKKSRGRVRDTLKRAFLPRLVFGDPSHAWKIVRTLEDAQAPPEVVRPVYYWLTIRNDRLMREFVTEHLLPRKQYDNRPVTVEETVEFIRGRLHKAGKEWSDSVTLKVARGLLAALRDFGILEGRAKKRIAASYLPVEAFAHIASTLQRMGFSGRHLVGHDDWRLFMLTPSEVEHLFLEADRSKLLHYQAAGSVVRVDFPEVLHAD